MHSFSLRIMILTTFIAATGLLLNTSMATAQSSAAPVVDKSSPAEKKIAEIHERIKRCAAIQELSIRMSCYDDYSVELGYITPDRAKADVKKLENIGVWQITQSDDGHGHVQTQLRSESLNKIPTTRGFERHVSLIIRCVPGRTEAMIDWKSPVDYGRANAAEKKMFVNYNTESTATVAEEWDVSTDKLALFSPDAIAFGRHIMNKKQLTFSFGTKGNSTSNTARFNIEGIETALDEIVKACYNNTPQKPQ